VTIEDVRLGNAHDYSAERVQNDARIARREVACFLAIIARHARDSADFCDLASAVMPDSMERRNLPLLYRALQAAERDAPRDAMLAVWDQARPRSRWSDEKIMMPALQAAALAYAGAGGRLSLNILLELLPVRRAELAGKAVQRVKGRLAVVGEEPSQVPSRKGALVKVYVLR
jgi:hypothetical protein